MKTEKGWWEKGSAGKDQYTIQIVVDGMENGLGLHGTHQLVNEVGLPNGYQPIGLSTVQGTSSWLNPEINVMARRKQGSTGPESAWAIARFNWTQQLLVCFGKIDSTTINNQTNINLPSLCINQITFWGKMNTEQIVGLCGNHSYIVFPVMKMENMTQMGELLAWLKHRSTWNTPSKAGW